MNQCASIRGNKYPDERCSSKSKLHSEWCGKHCVSMIRFKNSIEIVHTIQKNQQNEQQSRKEYNPDINKCVTRIQHVWRRWISSRAGPLLWFRELSNNPCDFFSSDQVTDIPMGDIVSFASKSIGYIMDIKSAISLVAHATKLQTPPLNPFNREQLPAIFLERINRHTKKSGWKTLTPMSRTQIMSLAVTDLFRIMEDMGNYTDPLWFLDLNALQLQRFYIELIDIWKYRAELSPIDRLRIVPDSNGYGNPFTVSVSSIRKFQQLDVLREILIATCKKLITSAVVRADRHLGTMYVLGALSIVSPAAGAGNPWLVESFSPGVTNIVNNALVLMYP